MKLDFEPTVIDSGIINLRVSPEVSQPDYSERGRHLGLPDPGIPDPPRGHGGGTQGRTEPGHWRAHQHGSDEDVER